jgi:predicted porin
MKTLLALSLMAGAVAHLSPAWGQTPPPAPTPAVAPPAAPPHTGPDIEIYGTLYPFTEYTQAKSATAGSAADLDGRFRMRVGTSNLGFRGGLPITDTLKLIWQVESAVPLDGDTPPAGAIASRNSHVGFASDYGTLIFGNWDTPWKWAHVTTINPIRAGYDWDYTMVLSTPGYGVNAIGGTAASFERRAPNSIQYWSPNVSGFTLRLTYSLDEGKTQANPAAMPPTVAVDPYLIGANLNYEGFGFRVRYAFELHKDFFGLSQLGGNGASATNGSSTDVGHALTIQYLTSSTDAPTRLVLAGDLLQYKDDDSAPGAINEYTRPGVYALVEQAFGPHHVFGAFGMGLEGSCELVGGADCAASDKTGAMYLNLGYLYAITAATNVHATFYDVINDDGGRFGSLGGIAAGADQIGFGIGVIHVFNVGLLGTPPPAK